MRIIDRIQSSSAALKEVQTSESKKGFVHKGSSVETGSGIAQQERAGDYVSPRIGSSPVATEGNQAPPDEAIPKKKPGRPKTGFDKTAYMKQYMRDKYAADKLGLNVSEYRKMKGE